MKWPPFFARAATRACRSSSEGRSRTCGARAGWVAVRGPHGTQRQATAQAGQAGPLAMWDGQRLTHKSDVGRVVGGGLEAAEVLPVGPPQRGAGHHAARAPAGVLPQQGRQPIQPGPPVCVGQRLPCPHLICVAGHPSAGGPACMVSPGAACHVQTSADVLPKLAWPPASSCAAVMALREHLCCSVGGSRPRHRRGSPAAWPAARPQCCRRARVPQRSAPDQGASASPAEEHLLPEPETPQMT